MNKPASRFNLARAYSLIELSIAMGMLGIVGGVVYTVLNGGMVLFSKNVATNYSNLAVRSSSQRMIQDLHESVGRAELVGTDLQPVATTTAPGVRFPSLLNPSATRVISDNSGNTTIPTVNSTSSVSLKIPQQTNAPKVGDIAIFPDINDPVTGNVLTRKLTAVTLGSPTVITMKDLGTTLTISTDTPPDPTLLYIARLAAYTIVTTATVSASDSTPLRTEVRYYADASDTTKYVVVNNNLTTFLPPLSSGSYVAPYGNGSVAIPAGPFSIFSSGPSDPGNSVNIQMISINADTGRRSFNGDRMLFSEIIPPKCLLMQSTNYN